MKAKDLSNLGKICSALFVIIAYITAAVTSKKIPSSDETFAMIQIGIFLAMSFLPVDISVIISNIKSMKDVVKD
jgi:hypothetical protein